MQLVSNYVNCRPETFANVTKGLQKFKKYDKAANSIVFSETIFFGNDNIIKAKKIEYRNGLKVLQAHKDFFEKV